MQTDVFSTQNLMYHLKRDHFVHLQVKLALLDPANHHILLVEAYHHISWLDIEQQLQVYQVRETSLKRCARERSRLGLVVRREGVEGVGEVGNGRSLPATVPWWPR